MNKMDWNQLLCAERIRSFQKSTTSNDMRTEFEKDYHRIIGSASFRRLQDKTQVFPLDKSDFIRTRLTHSLEVSSFAKSLAQTVGERILKEVKDTSFTSQNRADICDILQCAGLIHDIGNPPFGHFGETAIREWFKRNLPDIFFHNKPVLECLSDEMREDFYHFEGNTQALRVVSKLHFLVDEHGMNLTKALLGTIIKYPVSSIEINKGSGNIKDKKMGYYQADKSVFENIQKSLGTNGARHPLTYLLEAADDIAYKTADIEDAVKKGCISYHKLLEELKKFGAMEALDSHYFDMIEKLTYRYKKAEEKGYEDPELYAVQNWLVGIQGNLLYSAAACFIKNYQSIMSGNYKKDLFAGTSVQRMMKALGDIAYRYAFQSKQILQLEIAADSIFDFLFRRFVDAVIYYDTDVEQTEIQEKLMNLISNNYIRVYHFYAEGKTEQEKLYLRLLLVTDFICGMTDSYAKDLYQQLNGIV